jgi:hypothetical protein
LWLRSHSLRPSTYGIKYASDLRVVAALPQDLLNILFGRGANAIGHTLLTDVHHIAPVKWMPERYLSIEGAGPPSPPW